MRDHYTPEAVAVALAKHAPHRLEAILDPAVGTGTLLEALLKRCAASDATVTALDIDSTAISEATKNLQDFVGTGSQFIRTSFLKWVAGSSKYLSYDCIVMNPPFAARREEWVIRPTTMLACVIPLGIRTNARWISMR
jgi:methylase of polypeptide subunit release factors